MPVFAFWIGRLVLPPYAEVLHLFLRRSAVIMVGHEKGIRCLMPEEEACRSKFSRRVRPPFTRIPIAYHTDYFLISSRIHGCRVKFNHAVRNDLTAVTRASDSPCRCSGSSVVDATNAGLGRGNPSKVPFLSFFIYPQHVPSYSATPAPSALPLSELRLV
jgi:hypothetical protein